LIVVGLAALGLGICSRLTLENVTAQILVLYDVRELLVNVGGIYLHRFLFQVRRFERELIQDFFQNRVQTARADVFRLLIHAGGKFGDGLYGIFSELELDALGIQQGDVLLDERVLGLGEDAHEISFLQGLHLDADGETALKLWNQVGRLGDVKRASSNEQDVVGTDHAVACVDGGAFDDGKNVALHALARDIRTMTSFASGYLVDFVDENNAHLLGALDGHAGELIHVQKLVFFLLDEIFEGVRHGHLALLFLLAKEAAEHVFQIDVHLLDALVGDDLEGRHGAFTYFQVDHSLVQLAFAELCAEFFPGTLRLFALSRQFALGGSWRCGRRWRQ